jgi:hypothetical protein
MYKNNKPENVHVLVQCTKTNMVNNRFFLSLGIVVIINM